MCCKSVNTIYPDTTGKVWQPIFLMKYSRGEIYFNFLKPGEKTFLFLEDTNDE